jgi:DNA invertase Pin-like site-specific DNA recombinase
MSKRKYVGYYRVSTQRQGRSGLGLEAQRSAVHTFLNGGSWDLISEFTEIESGKVNDRPELQKALAACRVHGATLVIAKLDRLSRDAHFLLGLDKAGVDFVAADMPNANRLTVGIMALVAQQEREAISARTKAALAAAKERGTKLGRPENLSNIEGGARASALVRQAKAAARAGDLRVTLEGLQAEGVMSYSALARALNEQKIPSARGGSWHPAQVKRTLARL